MVSSNLISDFVTVNDFVDYDNGDYRITSTGTAGNAGSDALWLANSGNISTDISDNTRIQGAYIDLGCYENDSDYAGYVAQNAQTSQYYTTIQSALDAATAGRLSGYFRVLLPAMGISGWNGPTCRTSP